MSACLLSLDSCGFFAEAFSVRWLLSRLRCSLTYKVFWIFFAFFWEYVAACVWKGISYFVFCFLLSRLYRGFDLRALFTGMLSIRLFLWLKTFPQKPSITANIFWVMSCCDFGLWEAFNADQYVLGFCVLWHWFIRYFDRRVPISLFYFKIMSWLLFAKLLHKALSWLFESTKQVF